MKQSLFAFLVFFWSSAVLAQTPCPQVSVDAFSMARKSRRIVADYEKLHNVHMQDMRRLDLLYSAQTGREKPWGVGFAGYLDWQKNFGFESCTNLGVWDASLNPWTAGGIATFNLANPDIGVEVFSLLTIDRLEASPTDEQIRTPDGGFRDPTGLASVRQDEWMVGGRLSYTDWLSVVGGLIQSGPIQNITGEDGRQFVWSDSGEKPQDRVYLGVGVPALDLRAHLLFETEDVAPDLLELDLRGYWLPYDLLAIAGVAYVEDEGQVVLNLGVGNILGFLTTDLSLEHSPFGLRHARVRADLGKSWGFEPEDLAQIEPGLEAYPRFAFDAGGFVETSYFGSDYLQKQTGGEGVWGVNFGGYVQPDLTIWVNRMDIFAGVNQPEQISKLSDLRDHWHFGVRLYSRFGL